jgi:hypothetical protein
VKSGTEGKESEQEKENRELLKLEKKLFSLSLFLSSCSHESVVVGVVHHAELVDLVRPGAHGHAEGAVAVPAVAGGVGVEGEDGGGRVSGGGDLLGFGGGGGDLGFGGGGDVRAGGEDGRGRGPEDDAGRSRSSSDDSGSGSGSGGGSGSDCGCGCGCSAGAVGRGGVREGGRGVAAGYCFFSSFRGFLAGD